MAFDLWFKLVMRGMSEQKTVAGNDGGLWNAEFYNWNEEKQANRRQKMWDNVQSINVTNVSERTP